jgi:periplasmic divalent cation tolerance protein
VAGYLLVLTTLGSEEEALQLAHRMVERNLVACANVLPAGRSLYRWKDSYEDHPETLVLFKTRADAYAALEKAIQEVHPYEVPEVIAIPVERGSAAYLSWIDQSVKPEGS